jgi:hypothetical protein
VFLLVVGITVAEAITKDTVDGAIGAMVADICSMIFFLFIIWHLPCIHMADGDIANRYADQAIGNGDTTNMVDGLGIL